MWYSHAKPTYRIRYAESLDGIYWERSPIQFALEPSSKPAWNPLERGVMIPSGRFSPADQITHTLFESLKLLEHSLVPGAAAAFDVGLIQSARYGRQVRMLVQDSFALLAEVLGPLQQP